MGIIVVLTILALRPMAVDHQELLSGLEERTPQRYLAEMIWTLGNHEEVVWIVANPDITTPHVVIGMAPPTFAVDLQAALLIDQWRREYPSILTILIKNGGGPNGSGWQTFFNREKGIRKSIQEMEKIFQIDPFDNIQMQAGLEEYPTQLEVAA